MTNFERFVRNVTDQYNSYFEGRAGFNHLSRDRERQLRLIATASMDLHSITPIHAAGYLCPILENLDHARVKLSPDVIASAALSEARL